MRKPRSKEIVVPDLSMRTFLSLDCRIIVITLKFRELQVILSAKLPVPSHLNLEVPFAVLSNSNPLGSFSWSIEPAKPAGVLTPKVSEKLYMPGYPTTGLEL